MNTPKDLAEFDQNLALVGETTPAVIWALFSGFKEKGFTEYQAFSLAKEWMVEARDYLKRVNGSNEGKSRYHLPERSPVHSSALTLIPPSRWICNSEGRMAENPEYESYCAKYAVKRNLEQ